uniref:Protamine-2 n=1 Tax=Oryctolagus cuniculus TaxID=9986 RepID=A0A5F9DHF6_RABIT
MVRYRARSPSEHPHGEHGPEHEGEGQEPDQELTPETGDACGRTHRGRHRRRQCSRRRLHRIHRRRRRRVCRRRRRRVCRHRRRHRRAGKRTRRRRRCRRRH